MSGLIFNPSNVNNWRLLYQHQFRAQSISDRERELIPATVLPIVAESRILMAQSTVVPSRVTWRNGGSITPLINCGVAGFQDTGLGNYRLICNGSRLLIFPKLSTTYKLRFSCPHWFEAVTLTLYEYIGDESDSTENLIRELQLQLQLLSPGMGNQTDFFDIQIEE